MKRAAFTIVELVIVLAVIAILATLVIVLYGTTTRTAQFGIVSADLTKMAASLERIKADTSVYPADLAAAQAAGLELPTGGTVQYTLYPNSNPSRYCLTNTKDGSVGHVATKGQPVEGPCVGHTGTAPTSLLEGDSCPTNYIVVPGNSYFGTETFCVMKYEAKNVDGVATSQAELAPWASITLEAAQTAAAGACTGCSLMTEAQWLTIAANIMSVPQNWTGAGVGVGSLRKGHSDNSPASLLEAGTDTQHCFGTITAGVDPSCASGGAQQRTLYLTNGEIIWDFVGNAYEMTSQFTGRQPGLVGDAAYSVKQYTASNLQWNALSDISKPANVYPGAGSWSDTQGIGVINSNANASVSTNRVNLRGGARDLSASGVLGLNLASSTGSSNTVSFRATR